METSNAFDVLIVPILQGFAGIFATFPILHGIRVAVGNHFRRQGRPEAAEAPR
jgi:hypothetical protein